jgi:hypothetical protein
MSANRTPYNEQWINDHLDLYNYAVSIGDMEWQQELLLLLEQRDALIDEERKQQLKDVLWRRYDSINKQLLGIYSELRNKESKENFELIEQLVELKQQRLQIAKALESI